MDPLNQEWREEFFRACEYHTQRMKKSRDLRAQLLRDYAGSFYTEGLGHESRYHQPVNLMKQAAEAHMLSLAGGEIKFHVTANKAGLAPFAKHFTAALNNLSKEINLSETVRQLVLDSFFGLAIAKVYLADAPMVELEADVWMDPGQPFVSRVPYHDFLFDTDATEFRFCTFMGDRYRLPFYMIEEEPDRFDPEVVEEIHPTPRRRLHRESDEARAIAFGEETDEGEYEPHIELADIYFPREQIICTWAVDGRWDFINTPPLSVTEWEGSETGRYEFLNVGPVPDNLLPTSPAENNKFVFDMINSVYRKMNRQSTRQKDILLVAPGEEQTAENIRIAKDGMAVTAQTDVESIRAISLGGVNPSNLQFVQAVEQVADRMAGNLSARLGLGPSSETASQDRMINDQVGASQKAMQEKVVRFVSQLGRHLAWLLFDDPAREIPGTVRVEGTDYEYDSAWTPEYRQGTFDDYEYRVEPYSLPYKSPSERAHVLNALVQQLLPMMPAMQQQGIQFDFQKYLEKQAELLDAPSLIELFKVGPPTGESQSNHDATQSPVTQRETVRRSVSSGGPAQQQQALPQMGQQQQGPQIQ